jgi:predicted ABC-type ATPase
MARKSPKARVVVVAGPNGAGKSTLAPELLRGTLGVVEFVNADTIARGLSAFNEAGAAIAAGRVMLERLRYLARQSDSFAFETTLASRTFLPWIKSLKSEGWRFHLIYLWLPSPELAIARVANRVQLGGHDIPESVIRRRYKTGLQNFFELYQPEADSWRLYEAARSPFPKVVALGKGSTKQRILDKNVWSEIKGVAP